MSHESGEFVRGYCGVQGEHRLWVVIETNPGLSLIVLQTTRPRAANLLPSEMELFNFFPSPLRENPGSEVVDPFDALKLAFLGTITTSESLTLSIFESKKVVCFLKCENEKWSVVTCFHPPNGHFLSVALTRHFTFLTWNSSVSGNFCS